MRLPCPQITSSDTYTCVSTYVHTRFADNMITDDVCSLPLRLVFQGLACEISI